MQKVIILLVFIFFALFYLKESPNWNYIAAFGCILAVVYFAFMPTGLVR